jgi:hypothetical protein
MKRLSNVIRYSTEPCTCTPSLSTSKRKETNPFRSLFFTREHFSSSPKVPPLFSLLPDSWFYSVSTRTSGSKSNLVRAQRVTAHGDIPLPPFNSPADGRGQKGRKAAPNKTGKVVTSHCSSGRRETENRWAVCNVPG